MIFKDKSAGLIMSDHLLHFQETLPVLVSSDCLNTPINEGLTLKHRKAESSCRWGNCNDAQIVFIAAAHRRLCPLLDNRAAMSVSVWILRALCRVVFFKLVRSVA